MGRTMPSFRIALEMEKAEWKPYSAMPLTTLIGRSLMENV